MILAGGRVAQSAEKARSCDLEIRSRSRVHIDTSGHLVLPGLINAHDHLEFNLYPRLGRGPYPNSKAWAEDIYAPDRDPIRQHLQVPKAVRLLWGGIKNLLSGVTTVCHHNRRNDPTLDDNFPIRVVKRFGWAHSLEFSADVQRRFLETPKSWPFILHLGEATDARGREEIFQLHAMGALDHRTVLVHAVALDRKGMALVRKCGGSVVWCPSSNLFLLGRTLDPSVFRSGLPVALGSDSALTADGDLLDELRVGLRSIDAVTLYRMVTDTPRRCLRLPDTPGDVALFRDSGLNPAETLLNAGPPELVIVGGRIRLASVGFAARLPGEMVRRMFRFMADGREMLVDVDVCRLWRETAAVLGSEFRLAGKRVVPCT
jgi:cytosine/adenosine deaminase-related metal-dependent hydrolase